MTIDEFIEKGLRTSTPFPKPLRSSIRQKGFLFLVLHLRETAEPNGLALVVTHATVEFQCRGAGLLTKTLRQVRYKYPTLELVCEGVKEPRHQAKLIRLGFEPRLNQTDFVLPPTKDFHASS